MSIQVLSTGADPFYRQTTALEGVTFVFTFTFNQRCACWYLSLADANGVDIVNGVKLVCGLTLLRKCVDPRRPAGGLYVLSSSPDASPPALQDLVANSGRCKLLYITSDWLAILAAGNAADLLAQIAANTLDGTASSYGGLPTGAATGGVGSITPVVTVQGPRGKTGLAGPAGVGLPGNPGPAGPVGPGGALTMSLGDGVSSTGTNSSLPKRTGGRSYNPADFVQLTPTSTIVFHALLETTNATLAASLQLFRATGAGSPAVLATLSTTSTVAADVSVDVSTLFRPGQAAGIFLCNLYLATTSPTDLATCSGSWLEITP